MLQTVAAILMLLFLISKFCTLYGSWRLITIITRVHHWSL